MKLLFGFIIGTVILAIIVVLYCALTIAGRSNEQADMENSKGAKKMFWRKPICPRCKTGKDTYELDKRSETCPYIGHWKKGKCQFYVPIEKSSKIGIFKKNKNEKIVAPKVKY